MFRRSGNKALKKHLHHFNDIRSDVDTIEDNVSNFSSDMNGIVNDMNNSNISLQTIE